jgi:hypothetical protein
MNSKPKWILLRILSILMLTAALPMLLAYIQLAAGVLLIVPLHSYATLTLPPLFLLTVLYLFGVGWRKKRDYEQQ